MAGESRRPISRVNVALLAVYALATALIFYRESRAWPSIGSWTGLLLIVTCPGLIFQTLRLVYTWRAGRPLPWPILIRLVTIPAGLVLAGVLMSKAASASTARFTAAYAPMVEKVRKNLASPCGAELRYFADPVVATYNQRTWPRAAARAGLRYDQARFVMALGGGSIDIDGSTIYYDSVTRKWQQYHNDDAQARAAHEHLVEGLKECLIEGPPR
jgi:hypothetical protein